MGKLNPSNLTVKPYKEQEFNEFLRLIGKGNIESWSEIAQSLGVERETIYRWKRDPRAKKIINESIKEATEKMRLVGRNDWRMWREFLKMRGVADIEQVDVTSKGEKLQLGVDYIKSNE